MVHILIIRLKSFWRAVVQDHLWKRDIGSLWKNDGTYVFVWILTTTQVASHLQLQNKMFSKLMMLCCFIRRTWTWVRKRRLLWETKTSTKRKKWSSSIFVLPPKLWVLFFFFSFFNFIICVLWPTLPTLNITLDGIFSIFWLEQKCTKGRACSIKGTPALGLLSSLYSLISLLARAPPEH